MHSAALYADGGCVHSNPSPWGGTWAFRLVAEDGTANHAVSGAYVACGMAYCTHRQDDPFPHWPLPTVTNNAMEFVAVVLGLEALPDGWGGEVCSDSAITLHRLFPGPSGARFNGIPEGWIQRLNTARHRLHWRGCTPVLCKGHPTRQMMAVGHDGYKRVSPHNVDVDGACNWQKYLLFQRYGDILGSAKPHTWGCDKREISA